MENIRTKNQHIIILLRISYILHVSKTLPDRLHVLPQYVSGKEILSSLKPPILKFLFFINNNINFTIGKTLDTRLKYLIYIEIIRTEKKYFFHNETPCKTTI